MNPSAPVKSVSDMSITTVVLESVLKEEVVNLVNGVATVALRRDPICIGMYNPIINERRAFMMKQRAGRTLIYLYHDKVVAEVVSQHFIKLTQTSNGHTDVYFVDIQKEGEYQGEKCYFSTWYQPKMIDYETCLKKFSLLKEMYPEYHIRFAAYNRHGLIIHCEGLERGYQDEEVVFWLRPEQNDICCYSTHVHNFPDYRGNRTINAEGCPELKIIGEGVHSTCMINDEPAERINLSSISPETWAKVQAARQKENQEHIARSGIEIINHTHHLVTMRLLIDRSRETKMNHYFPRLNGKRLLLPTNNKTCLHSHPPFSLARSQKVTFEAAPEGFVKLTEVDDKSTNVWYIDANHVLNGLAYRIYDYLPKAITPQEVYEALQKSEFISKVHHVFKVGAFNRHGIALIMEDSSKKEMEFYYSAPGNSRIIHIECTELKWLYESSVAVANSAFVRFEALRTQIRQELVCLLNKERAHVIPAAVVYNARTNVPLTRDLSDVMETIDDDSDEHSRLRNHCVVQ